MLLVKLGNRVVAERREFIEKSHLARVACLGTGDWKPERGDLSADHHSATNAQRLEYPRDWFAQFGARHADQLHARPSRIQKRAQEVEDRPLAALGAQPACRPKVFEGGMVIRREEKGELMVAQRTRGRLRLPI